MFYVLCCLLGCYSLLNERDKLVQDLQDVLYDPDFSDTTKVKICTNKIQNFRQKEEERKKRSR